MVQYSRHAGQLDASFAALADRTRRGVLQRLGRGQASISDLADDFAMTLTGMKKHVHVLELAGLVATRKLGRVRLCRLGPRSLRNEAAWLESCRNLWEKRLDRFGEMLKQRRAREEKRK